jgi:hypothetical protein
MSINAILGVVVFALPAQWNNVFVGEARLPTAWS